MWRGSMRGGGRFGLLTVRCTRGSGDRGRGTIWFAGGNMYLTCMWGASGRGRGRGGGRSRLPTAWRLRDGQVVGVISLDKANRTAQALGQAVLGQAVQWVCEPASASTSGGRGLSGCEGARTDRVGGAWSWGG